MTDKATTPAAGAKTVVLSAAVAALAGLTGGFTLKAISTHPAASPSSSVSAGAASAASAASATTSPARQSRFDDDDNPGGFGGRAVPSAGFQPGGPGGGVTSSRGS